MIGSIITVGIYVENQEIAKKFTDSDPPTTDAGTALLSLQVFQGLGSWQNSKKMLHSKHVIYFACFTSV